jgi:hypothetical protein
MPEVISSVAAADLAQRQRRSPPYSASVAEGGDDRVSTVYGQLAGDLPDWITQLVDEKKLALGEIGLTAPDAYATAPFSDGSMAVHVTSGYIRLFDAVATDLASTMPLGTDGQGPPALSVTDAVFHTVSLLEQVRQKRLIGGLKLDTRRLDLPPIVQKVAAYLSDSALRFVLAHELGHVAASRNSGAASNASAEQEADDFGLSLLLASRRPRDVTRLGALFTLRFHLCVQRAGFTFKDFVTSIGSRFAALEERIRGDSSTSASDLQAIAELEAFFSKVEEVLDFTSRSRPPGSAKTPLPTSWQSASVLKELQAREPPWDVSKDGGPLDQTRFFLQLLAPLLGGLEPLLSSGRVSVGEVGRPEPIAERHDYADGSVLVILSSGLIFLLLAASRFLHAGTAIATRDGGPPTSCTDPAAAATVLADIFCELGANGLTQDELFCAVPGFWSPSSDSFPCPIADFSSDHMRLATDLAYGAGSFILLSKLLGRETRQDEFASAAPAADIPAGEVAALVLFALSVPFLGFRQSYPAVQFALRFRDWLAAVGVGAPLLRLETIDDAPWRCVGSPRAYDYLCRLNEAYDLTGRLGLRRLQGGALPRPGDLPAPLLQPQMEPELLASDCQAWFIAGGIYQCAQEDAPKEDVLAALTEITAGLSPAALGAFASSLRQRVSLKLVLPEHEPDHDFAQAEVDILEWLIAQAAEPVRAAFAALESTSSAEAVD